MTSTRSSTSTQTPPQGPLCPTCRTRFAAETAQSELQAKRVRVIRDAIILLKGFDPSSGASRVQALRTDLLGLLRSV